MRLVCQKKNLTPNKINMNHQITVRTKGNIHVCFAMNPLIKEFSGRMRMFPAFINCCNIDWFSEWPEEALQGVAMQEIVEYEQEIGIEGERDQLIEMLKFMHKEVEKQTTIYK